MNHFTTMQEEVEIWIYTFMIKWKIKVLEQISMDDLKKKKVESFLVDIKVQYKYKKKKIRIWYTY